MRGYEFSGKVIESQQMFCSVTGLLQYVTSMV